jgi:hypothetical protein
VLGPLLNLVLIGRIHPADLTIADLLYRREPAFAAILKATDRIAVVRIRLSFPGHRPGNHDDVLVVVKELAGKNDRVVVRALVSLLQVQQAARADDDAGDENYPLYQAPRSAAPGVLYL